LRIASLVFGIVGGVAGILAGLFAIVFGGLGAVFEAKDSGVILGIGLGACFLGVCGIVGGALALRLPIVSAIIQGGVGLMSLLVAGWFWVLACLLLVMGAVLAALGHFLEANTGDRPPR
jgi:hypothetical protein